MIEEIESSGASDRRELRNRLRVLLDDNRSLRRDVGDFIAREIDAARDQAERSLVAHHDAGRIDPAATLSADQVLDDWWPA